MISILIQKTQAGSGFILASTHENGLYFWGNRHRSDEEKIQIQRVPSLISGTSSDEPRCVKTDCLVVGSRNMSLMEIIQEWGHPDSPIIQVKDPKMVFQSMKELQLLRPVGNSRRKSPHLKRDLILKPQSIVSLYSSQVHLKFGETIGFSNFYCFRDDSVYLVIETNIENMGGDETFGEKEITVKLNEKTVRTELISDVLSDFDKDLMNTLTCSTQVCFLLIYHYDEY